MRLTLKNMLSLAVIGAFFATYAQAQTLVDVWSYNRTSQNDPQGGGLDPATYGGSYRPAALTPNAGSNGGGSITVTGMGPAGGLGSSSFPQGYGGYYTLFSTNVSFIQQTAIILPGLDTITFSLFIGGGSPDLLSFDQSTITLNYNGSNPALSSTFFESGTPVIVDSPIGDQTLTLFTWTWTNLSAMGTTPGFSISWDTQGSTDQANAHVFLSEVSVTQSVPEPSTLCIIAAAGVLFAFRRRPCVSAAR